MTDPGPSNQVKVTKSGLVSYNVVIALCFVLVIGFNFFLFLKVNQATSDNRDLIRRLGKIEKPSPKDFEAGIEKALRFCLKTPTCRAKLRGTVKRARDLRTNDEAHAILAKEIASGRLSSPSGGSVQGVPPLTQTIPAQKKDSGSDGGSGGGSGGGGSSPPSSPPSSGTPPSAPPQAPAPAPTPQRPPIDVHLPPAPVPGVCTPLIGVNC